LFSRQVCNENAVRFSKLLLAYREHYGVNRIFSSMLHMIFIATTTLISQLSTDPRGKGESNNKKWLAVCLQAFSDVSTSFHLAGRVHKVIASFLEGCGYPELAPLGNCDTTEKHADQQKPQSQEEAGPRRHSHDVYPTSSLTLDLSESENISDTTIPVNDFGFHQPFPSFNTVPWTYTAAEGLEGLLNMDAYQTQPVFQGFEKANVSNTTNREMNLLGI